MFGLGPIQIEDASTGTPRLYMHQYNDELYFRYYLNEHPQIAKEYEALKLELWKRYEHDRDAYTDAKTAFIRKLTAEARRVYGDRY